MAEASASESSLSANDVTDLLGAHGSGAPPLAQRTNNNIDFVLLAEFDVDKGSVLRSQFPEPIPCDHGCEPSSRTLACLSWCAPACETAAGFSGCWWSKCSPTDPTLENSTTERRFPSELNTCVNTCVPLCPVQVEVPIGPYSAAIFTVARKGEPVRIPSVLCTASGPDRRR